MSFFTSLTSLSKPLLLARPKFIEPTSSEKLHVIKRVMVTGSDLKQAKAVLESLEVQDARLRHLRHEFDIAAKTKHKIFGAIHSHTADQNHRPSPDKDRAAFAKWFFDHHCPIIGEQLNATIVRFGLLRVNFDQIKHDLDNELRYMKSAVGFHLVNRLPSMPDWFDTDDQRYFDVCYLICREYLKRFENSPAVLISISGEVDLFQTRLDIAREQLERLTKVSSAFVPDLEKILKH